MARIGVKSEILTQIMVVIDNLKNIFSIKLVFSCYFDIFFYVFCEVQKKPERDTSNPEFTKKDLKKKVRWGSY